MERLTERKGFKILLMKTVTPGRGEKEVYSRKRNSAAKAEVGSPRAISQWRFTGDWPLWLYGPTEFSITSCWGKEVLTGLSQALLFALD